MKTFTSVEERKAYIAERKARANHPLQVVTVMKEVVVAASYRVRDFFKKVMGKISHMAKKFAEAVKVVAKKIAATGTQIAQKPAVQFACQ